MNKLTSLNQEYCINFKQVSVRARDTTILNNINCIITEPRVAIIGNNGSGKSSFARCATGVSSIYDICKVSGTVTIHGLPLAKHRKQLWKSINMTFQIPDQQILMPSVEEELLLGLKYSDFDKVCIQEKIDYALSILQVPKAQSCHSLSAGQKRLLCLLSIVLIEPHTIILDEPTTFLDLPTRLQFMDIVATLSQQVIIITHDLFLIEKFDRALCFHKGEIHYDGKVSETIAAYKALW